MEISNTGKKQCITFTSRCREIRDAERILHTIKSKFPACSPFIADCNIKKRGKKNEVGAKISTKKLTSMRMVLKKHISDDYEYCGILLALIKRSGVMNCKENSELAYLIARANGYKNCICAELSQKQNSYFKNLDHTILLLNQDIPKNIQYHDKFYIDIPTELSTIQPSKKAIVIDPMYGIVDYWDNFVLKYKSIFDDSSISTIFVSPREKIIKKQKDIIELAKSFPELLFQNNAKIKSNKIWQKIKDIINVQGKVFRSIFNS